MYQTENLGKMEIGKCYVYSIGRKLLVTNIERSSKNNTRKILSELSRMKVIKHDNDMIEKNLDMFHSELKNLGSLHKFVSIDFKKLSNDEDIDDIKHYAFLKSDNFGGSYGVNEVKIILI